ncbi:MAG: hypothetical protein KGH58_01270 [Candidatus Micrarchaeota archaeon]|nr:hypothetical protein [Candidatus Micrarchaeota archaeon]
MRQDKSYAAILAVSAVSAASSLFYNIYLGTVLCACSAAALLVLLRLSKTRSFDRDALRLASNIVEYHTADIDIVSLLTESASPSMRFYDKLIDAIRAYRLSGDAQGAFSALLGSDSEYLRTVIWTVVNGLDNGSDILLQLKEQVQTMEADLSLRERAAGSAAGAAAIIRFGTMLFLPIFAGISMDILRFATILNSSVMSVSPDGFALIMSLFIAVSNTINFRYAPYGFLEKTAKSAASAAVGIAVFRIASALAMSML